MTTTTVLSREPSRPARGTRSNDAAPLGRVFIFGFALWAIVFGTATSMVTWRLDNRPLFEAVIPVVLALVTTTLATGYLAGVRKRFMAHGVLIGSAWAAFSVVIDLPMFLAGPMRMPIGDYLQDIGVTYLMIPIITIGLAYQRALGNPGPR